MGIPSDIHILRSPEEILTLENDWRRLFSETERSGPFLSWTWVSTWLKHFGATVCPFVLVWKPEGKVRGILPLGLPVSSPKTLRFLHACEITSPDDLGPLVATKDLTEFWNLIGMALRHSSDWSEIDLREWNQPPEITAQVRNALGLPFGLTQCHPYAKIFWIPLPETMEEYLRTVSKNRRGQLRNQMNQFAKKLHIRSVTPAVGPDCSPAFETLHELHAKRWAHGYSPFATEAAKSFHSDLIRISNDGELNPIVLQILHGERTIAALYGFSHRKTFFFYQSGRSIDPEYTRIGSVLIARSLEYCIQERYQIFDFLRGDEDYKEIFTQRVRINERLTIVRLTSPRGTLLAGTLWAKELAKRMLGRSLLSVGKQ